MLEGNALIPNLIEIYRVISNLKHAEEHGLYVMHSFYETWGGGL